jgi:aspartate carbamoyltransferase catalytic subunit
MSTPAKGRTVPHFLGTQDITTDILYELFAVAEQFRRCPHDARRHTGRIVALLFYEPSTRTNLSFASATCRLGADQLGFDTPKSASVTKGESLIDTIRVVQRYCDLIVMRHPADGSARLASSVSMVPIINGGDGGHEHPTQTLCDLYTIWQRFGSFQGRAVGIMGDLRFGRTAHSLALALAGLGATLVCLAPEDLQMPPHLLRRLRGLTEVRLEHRLDAVIADLDVLYVTRLQKERMKGTEQTSGLQGYPLERQYLASARPGLLILHPLPRSGEIAYDVDEDFRAWYFEQAANGVLTRMALLDRLLVQAPALPLGALPAPQPYAEPPWAATAAAGPGPCGNPQCVTHHEHDIAPRFEPSAAAAGAGRCVYCEYEFRFEGSRAVPI